MQKYSTNNLFFNFSEYCWFTKLCYFLLYRKVSQLYIYMYILFFRFYSHIDYYRLLSRGPCAMQKVILLFLVQLLSHVGIFVTTWTGTHQAPLSMGYPRQEYWSELPFPSPEDLPDPGIGPVSLLAGRFFTIEPPGKPSYILIKLS